MCHGGATCEFIFRIFLLHEIVQSGLPLRLLSRRHPVGRPCGRLTGSAGIVEVVEVAEDGDARVVGETQGEEPGQVAVMGTAAHLDISYPTGVVLPFQVHVHHVGLVAEFLVEHLPAQTRLVIDLHLLDHVGGQVVEHDLAVFGEEVLAVKQQALHILAVDIDAAVVLQFHAGQLTDESVEHASLGELEGIGVEDERVALVVELDLRCLDLHLAEAHRLGCTLHQQVGSKAHGLVSTRLCLLGRQQHVGGLIAVELGLEQHVLHVGGGTGDPIDIGQVAGLLVLGGVARGVDHHAVGGQQRHADTIEKHVGEVVLRLADDHAGLVLLLSHDGGHTIKRSEQHHQGE